METAPLQVSCTILHDLWPIVPFVPIVPLDRLDRLVPISEIKGPELSADACENNFIPARAASRQPV